VTKTVLPPWTDANAHTIQFDNGSTKSLILNCTKFKWIAEASEASDLHGGRLARYRMSMNRDVVHRKLKIFHEGRDKWFHGTIVGFSEVWEAPDQVRILEKGERVQFKQEKVSMDGLDRSKTSYETCVDFFEVYGCSESIRESMDCVQGTR
jgi:hypothetical protein